MKAIPLYHYVYMGTNIWFLQTVSETHKINESGGVRENLSSLLSKLEEFGFPVSRRAAWALERYVAELSHVHDERLGAESKARVRELAGALRPTINAESWGVFAHILTEKRYSSDYLMNNPWKIFSEDVKSRIDDVAILDLEEASKCIVFERPTAAAFHLLRATESVLKHFYCHTVRRNRSQLMWGPMVLGLRNRRNPPDSALLDHLDGIRRNFRNPTQHPEKIYDLTEAQDLFGICLDVINRMAIEMPVRV